MTTIANLLIRLGVDVRDVSKAEQAAPVAEKAGQKAGQKFASGFGGALGAIKGMAAGALAAVSFASVASGVMEVTNAASDLNEATTKTQTIFGGASAQVLKFAESAETAMGQSRVEALNGMNTFALYGKQANLTGKQLVNFSADLSTLASDLGSFHNASPQEAIEAIGSALRGESDPIERFGILLNESVIQARALKMGLIDSTKNALTPQQRVLAATAEIYAQSAVAQGDFQKNSASLANQQRILSAQWTNLKATLGQALLPVMTQFVTMLNTEVIPALREMWAQHGPGVTAVLSDLGTSLGDFLAKAQNVDWATLFERGRQAIQDLGPALATVKDNGPLVNDTLSVGAEVMGFLADHADLVAKALPYLAAGLVLVKLAQIGANAAQAVSPILTIAAALANRRLAASNMELAAAMTAQTTAMRGAAAAQAANTVATNAGTTATKKGMVANIAARAATLAGAVASGIATAAQWLWNTSLYGFPLVWIIAAVLAVIAIIVLIAKKTDWFSKAWSAIWGFVTDMFKLWWSTFSGMWLAIGQFFVNLFKTWWSIFTGFWSMVFDAVLAGVRWVTGKIDAIVNFVGGLRSKITSKARGMFDGIVAAGKGGINKLISLWNRLDLGWHIGIPNWVPLIGGASFTIPDLIPDIPMLADGGIVRARPGGTLAILGEAGHDEAVVPLPHGSTSLPAGGAGGGTMTMRVEGGGGSAAEQKLVELVLMLIRTGKIRLRVASNGKDVTVVTA